VRAVRILAVVALVATSVGLIGPATAEDELVFRVVTSRSTYLPGDDELGTKTLVITKGAPLELVNADVYAAHGLSSDEIVPETGRRLFESTIANFRGTTPVMGVGALPPGEYPFHCPIHEDNMHGVLVVH
jgi:hypothetical protein